MTALHTARNTRFEMEQTLPFLASGDIMIVDDISPHQAFANFARDFPRLGTLVCPHSDRAGSFSGSFTSPHEWVSVTAVLQGFDGVYSSSPSEQLFHRDGQIGD